MYKLNAGGSQNSMVQVISTRDGIHRKRMSDFEYCV